MIKNWHKKTNICMTLTSALVMDIRQIPHQEKIFH